MDAATRGVNSRYGTGISLRVATPSRIAVSKAITYWGISEFTNETVR